MVDELRHEHEEGPEPRAVDIASGHEHSDASIPGLVVFLVGLAVSMVVVVFAIAWMFDWFVERSNRQDPPPAPLAELRRQRPPAPRLQEAPRLDMEALRAAQLQKLDKATWIDKQAGVVQMPIEQAMRQMVDAGNADKPGDDLTRTEQTEQGLPKWPPVKSDQRDDPPTESTESPLPGTGKNPDAKSRASVKEQQPSDVTPIEKDRPAIEEEE
jgi:hypothetical protein